MNLDEFKTLEQLAAGLKSLGLGPLVANVKQFGAKGDDSTDDTVAIQSAIDQVAAGDHGTVFFPAGTYRISSSLVMDSRVSLIGETTLATIIKATAAITMIKMEIGETSVENLRLIGFDRTSSSSIAIQIGGGANNNVEATIKDIRILSGHYYGIYCTQECDGTLIDRVTMFDAITKAAIYINWDGVTGSKSASVIIRRCSFNPPPATIIGEVNYGIYIQGTDTCKLESNITNNFDYGVYLGGSVSSGNWSLLISGHHTEERRTGIYSGTRWSASASISQDDIILPTKDNATGFVYKAQGNGTTGGTEPTWPTTYGGTVVDNTVTWEAIARSVALHVTSYVKEVQISGWYDIDHIYGIEDASFAQFTIQAWHSAPNDYAFIKTVVNASYVFMSGCGVTGNFKPYSVTPGTGDANVIFSNVTWTGDNLGYVPIQTGGLMGYHTPINLPIYPRVTVSASSYNLDIREFRYVVADSTSADVTINLPTIDIADEGIIITVFKYPSGNNVIVDANTVGSKWILTSAGNATTRTITTRAGHLTITPLSTPAGMLWMILSEAL